MNPTASEQATSRALITDIFLGKAPLLTGVENGRCYVGPRWEGVYFDSPPEAVEACEKAWAAGGGHIFLPPNLTEIVEKRPVNDTDNRR